MYILILIIRNPFPTAQESIRIFLKRWIHPNKVNIVADAAFGSMEMLESIEDNVCNKLVIF